MSTSDVHRAVALRLQEVGVGTFKPTGVYSAGETGITLKAVPQSPDRIVAISIYAIDEDPDPTDPRRTYSVQLRFRAGTNPTDVDDIADAAYQALSVDHQEWGTVRVNRCYRTVMAPLGMDANGRQERADSYRIVTQR